MLLETLFLFYFNQVGLPHMINAMLYFGSSMAFGIVLIAMFYDKKTALKHAADTKMVKTLFIGAVSLGLLSLCLYKTNLVINAMNPAESSDVITTVEIASQRLLDKVPVYKTHIYATDHELPLTYLPMHWLPYTISSYFHFDARWITFSIWLLAVAVLTIRNYRYEQLTPLLCMGLLSYILYRNAHMIGDTIELMVAGYYMLLITCLNRKDALLQGIMIGICLLSRFSLLLWLPLYAIILLASRNRKELSVSGITASIFVVLVYVIPFLSTNWGSFMEGYHYYSNAALGEWQKGEVPFHLHRGTGFAYYYYYFLDIPLADRLKWLQRSHLAATFVIVSGLAYWYLKYKDHIHYKIFVLGSFKLYLTVFLVFIQVPYEYLMVVGNFVSIAIFTEQARYRVLHD
ncbi:MAG: hypothetical protein JNL72_15270 [Flavipsychrobacter sp.]|nr:hypothetical protein [Flavipsychrobacter sp.]